MISRAGANFLKDLEGGFVAETYYVFGVPHNGYGFNLDFHDLPQPITRAEADAYFDELTANIADVIKAEFGPVNQCEMDGLTSLVYNLGFVPDSLVQAYQKGPEMFYSRFLTTAITVGGEYAEPLAARRRHEVQYMQSCNRFQTGAGFAFLAILILLAYGTN